MTTISRFRASFVWVESVPSILAGTLPANAPFVFLAQVSSYAQCFDACQNGGKGPGGIELPWVKPGNYFWNHYFEGTEATEMKGSQAWKKFVPFRATLKCKTVTPNPAATVSFEAFYAPQGIATVGKIDYAAEPAPILDVIKRIFDVRYDYKFVLDGSGGPASGTDLDHTAAAALSVARRNGFGASVASSPGLHQPFSIASFIEGDNVNITTPVADGSDEHRALEAVTTWNPYFDTIDLSTVPIAGAKLKMHTLTPSDLLYARKGGQAIWLPRAFAKSKKPTISCYHRNRTLAGVQTLSLGEFISWVAACHTGGKPVAAILDERAKRAAAVLQLISDGKLTTYRTFGAADQITKANWAADIAVVKALP